MKHRTLSPSLGTPRLFDDKSLIPGRPLQSILGKRVNLPDPELLVHLQFRRFAGCPVCNLHLQSFVRAHDQLVASGIREIVVFHSSIEDLRAHASDLPFAVIADPGKRLYVEFGVQQSPRALFDPRVWGTIMQAVAHSLAAVFRGRQPMPSLVPPGGRFGLPADFLIRPDGRVLAHKYGAHAYDQWSVAELLQIARQTQPAQSFAHSATIPATRGSQEARTS